MPLSLPSALRLTSHPVSAQFAVFPCLRAKAVPASTKSTTPVSGPSRLHGSNGCERGVKSCGGVDGHATFRWQGNRRQGA